MRVARVRSDSRQSGSAVQQARKAWTVLRGATKRFQYIDGGQWAGAFAFNALFSLLPSLVLFVTLASSFVDPDRAGKTIITYLESYVPMNAEMQGRIFAAIAAVIDARGRAGVLALPMLIWSALQCFTTLVRVTNRAWGDERYDWWHLPVKGLVLLGTTGAAVVAGLLGATLASVGRRWFLPVSGFSSGVYTFWGFVVPLLVLCASLTLFYRLAPRRPTKFAEVWPAALCATALFQLTESLFVVYLQNFSKLNVLYGAFGGVMAFLLWIYLVGCIFVFGACVCAARARNV